MSSDTIVKVFGHYDADVVRTFIETCNDAVLLVKIYDIIFMHNTVLELGCRHYGKPCDNPACKVPETIVKCRRDEIEHELLRNDALRSQIRCTGCTVESILERSMMLQQIATFDETLRMHRPVTGDEDYELYLGKSDIENCKRALSPEAFKKWMDNMIRTSVQTNWMRKVVATRPKPQQNLSVASTSSD
jgi:hypothetical protein